MNKGLLSILKQRLLPSHDPEGPTGKLSEAEHASIYALFQTLTADEAFPAERVRAYVDDCTLHTPGMLDDFRFAIELVDRYAARVPSGKHAPRSKFRELSSADREGPSPTMSNRLREAGRDVRTHAPRQARRGTGRGADTGSGVSR